MGTHFINGAWKIGTGQLFNSINPTSLKKIWEGTEGTQDDVEEAIESANCAFSMWGALKLKKRLVYLNRFTDSLRDKKQHMAEIISLETGKPLWESTNEVTSMVNKLSLSIESNATRCADIIKTQTLGELTVRHRPHGVMAVFGPYNLPGHVPHGQIIPALLAGNTIVYKPSELTPLVAETIMQLWQESGIPQGVINLVQGGKNTGDILLHHPLPHGFLFTGSWKTGQYFAQTLAKQPGKILVTEMGGNNPLIIGEINDLDAAAYLTIQSAFITSGQRCTCARRLIIPTGKQGDKFLATLIEMTQKIRIGAYNESPQPFMGPVISSQVATQLLEKHKELLNMGGIDCLALKQLKLGPAFLSPGIIDVTPILKRSDEEIFGPLLQVIRVANFEKAIAEANHTDYGLTAGLLSDNQTEYQIFHHLIKAGVVNWNTPLTGLSGAAPFGGIKHSGNHRPVGFYAADFCAYPVASLETPRVHLPSTLSPGCESLFHHKAV